MAWSRGMCFRGVLLLPDAPLVTRHRSTPPLRRTLHSRFSVTSAQFGSANTRFHTKLKTAHSLDFDHRAHARQKPKPPKAAEPNRAFQKQVSSFVQLPSRISVAIVERSPTHLSPAPARPKMVLNIQTLPAALSPAEETLTMATPTWLSLKAPPRGGADPPRRGLSKRRTMAQLTSSQKRARPASASKPWACLLYTSPSPRDS